MEERGSGRSLLIIILTTFQSSALFPPHAPTARRFPRFTVCRGGHNHWPVLDNRSARPVRWRFTTRPCRISRRVTLDTDPPLPPEPAEEAEWIRAAQTGDRSAFARLIERYWDRLYRWLYHLTRDRHNAEDLTQETFLKALAAITSFRPGSNFRAWIFRIGHNNFVNQKRSERRTKHQLPEDAASPEMLGLAESTTEHRETLEAVS